MSVAEIFYMYFLIGAIYGLFEACSFFFMGHDTEFMSKPLLLKIGFYLFLFTLSFLTWPVLISIDLIRTVRGA